MVRGGRYRGTIDRWQSPSASAPLAGIGHTPIVRLSSLTGADDAEVWVKLEAANPTGSYKDRMALAMIEGAERRGRLQPGQTVVEYTGGSTGSSLAFVCSVKGYPLRIVTSTAFAEEKLRTMAVFGADARHHRQPRRHHPRPDPADAWRGRPRSSPTTGGFPTDQFNNRDALDGYREIGEEIVDQLDDPIDAFCTTSASGGASSGRPQHCGSAGPRCCGSRSNRKSRP